MSSLPPELPAVLRSIPGLRLWRRAPLAPFTTVGVGGRADLLVSVLVPEALPPLLAELSGARVPWAVVGAGSNLLVADGGYRGVAVKLEGELSYVEVRRGRAADLTAGAALGLARLATFAADRGLAGLEFTCGIPGTVGGAAAMNAGAHGSSLGEVLQALEVATPEGLFWVDANELEWAYRSSSLPQGSVVSAVALSLTPAETSEVLARHRALLRLRRQMQPRGVRSFGSTFKNPPGESAGRLLERAGMKGARRGGAEVSSVHANFIGNVGDATATDVLGLMTMMREAVYMKHQVFLEPEVKLLGARFPWQG